MIWPTTLFEATNKLALFLNSVHMRELSVGSDVQPQGRTWWVAADPSARKLHGNSSTQPN